ncbi:MAG: class I SAM-dependent methyltransferase [Candidatus Woesebacteria bacterium]|jgi:SAM-dependent methyltransferase
MADAAEKKWSEYYESLIKIKPSNIILHFGYILRVLSFRPKTILEIGCGPADHAMFIRKIMPHIKVYLVDNDSEILKKVGERYKGAIAGTYGIDVLDQKAVTQLSGFDVVMSQGLLEHFNDEDFLKIIANFSSVGKVMVFSIPSNEYEHKDFGNEILRSKEQVEELLRKQDYKFSVKKYFDVGIRNKLVRIREKDLALLDALKYMITASGHLLGVVDYRKKRK